jgi:hypothetical protein
MAKLLELLDRENGLDAGEGLELKSLRSVFAELCTNCPATIRVSI